MLLYFSRKDLRKDLRDTSADRTKFSNEIKSVKNIIYIKNSNSINNTFMLNQDI